MPHLNPEENLNFSGVGPPVKKYLAQSFALIKWNFGLNRKDRSALKVAIA